MLTYAEIRKRPPEKPRTEVFSSSDLKWSMVKAQKGNIDNVAVIPYSEVKGFVKGEESRDGYTTTFNTDVTRGNDVSPDKPRADAILRIIRYHCYYGPDDNREHGIARDSRKCLKASEKKCRGRPSRKAGCQCRFFVKRYVAQPNVAFIVYNHQQHVDRNGSPCHGTLYDKAHKARPTWLFKKRRPLYDMVTPTWFVKKKRTAISEKLKVK